MPLYSEGALQWLQNWIRQLTSLLASQTKYVLRLQAPRGDAEIPGEGGAISQHMFPLTTDETAAEPQIQVSQFGVIPKRGKEGKWRLIGDLTTPLGRSVND